jgi:hypothetical protein
MAENKTAKEKSYLIKVPVYASEFKEGSAGLFGRITYENLVQNIINKIEEYNRTKPLVSKYRRNKVQQLVIGEVQSIECEIGDHPSVLLRITAFNTNLHDGYIETNENKIAFQTSHKLGSDTNFMLLYPQIIGLSPDKYRFQWLILLYEDPNKENLEIVSIAKLVLTKILDISIINVKLPEVLEELRKIDKIPELSLKFSDVIIDGNEVDAKFRSYLVNSKLKKLKEVNFKDIPYANTEEIINDTSYKEEFQKREIKIISGNKEFRITRDQKAEASESLNNVVEEIFNERTEPLAPAPGQRYRDTAPYKK